MPTRSRRPDLRALALAFLLLTPGPAFAAPPEPTPIVSTTTHRQRLGDAPDHEPGEQPAWLERLEAWVAIIATFVIGAHKGGDK